MGTREYTLIPELLSKRAANYLSVGQIYLRDNPLLKRPRTLVDVKRMLLGHWGVTPGQNFIYVHLSRVDGRCRQSTVLRASAAGIGPAMIKARSRTW
jgi:xylulose-5-phosphate/fructose-6-phosphate phosphoketolase